MNFTLSYCLYIWLSFEIRDICEKGAGVLYDILIYQ